MSSFVKFNKGNKLDISGVSIQRNGQKTTSTGNLGLDSLLGNGQELGSLVLIGEDKYGKYSKIFTKLWLSEGVTNRHKIFLADFDDNPQEMIKAIPVLVANPDQPKVTQTSIPDQDEGLRIAFRYSSLAKVNSERATSTGNTYDLSKKYDPEKFSNMDNLKFFSYDDFLNAKLSKGNLFEMLYDAIRNECDSPSDNLLRICLSSVGSPFWYSESFVQDFIQFVKKLKSLVRYYDNVVCMITIPTYLITAIDDQLIYHIRNYFDCCFDLESFDENTNPYYKEYNGQLFIRKLQSINSMQSPKPETYDLAFKLKRNRFLIEKLHLPQVLLDADPREPTMSMGCSTNNNKSKLDF